MPKHKTRYTFYCMTSSVDGIWHVYVILQKKNKIFCKNCDLKTSSGPFCVCKELAPPLLENEIFEARYLYYIYNSKTV